MTGVPNSTRWIVVLADSDAALFGRSCNGTGLGVPPSRVLYAPRGLHSRGAVPAILARLIPIASQDPNAAVAIVPSGQYDAGDGALSQALDSAFDIAETISDSIALLGARATHATNPYGWISLGTPVGSGSFRVRALYDKPSQPFADLFLQRGMLWNTGAMTGNAMTYLAAIYRAAPDAFKLFPRGETLIDEALYADFLYLDFWRDVLAPDPGRLMAHCPERAEWRDCPQHAGDEMNLAAASLDTGLPIAG